jgi:ATPase subunit of ABC transporter with duplicated ATPase domains
VTTASSVDAVELAQVYTHRWSAQENSIRDFLLSLGLDTNHGFAKVQIENSEAAKIREALERKLAKAMRRAEGARERMAQAQERSRKVGRQAKAQQARLVRLNAARQQLAEQQERPDRDQVNRMVAEGERAQTALANCQRSKQRAEQSYLTAWDACEHACSQQRFLLRELDDRKREGARDV